MHNVAAGEKPNIGIQHVSTYVMVGLQGMPIYRNDIFLMGMLMLHIFS